MGRSPTSRDFLNAVAELESGPGARQLLDRLLEVERELGRVRDGKRWGPRDDRPRPARSSASETIDEPGSRCRTRALARAAVRPRAAGRARARSGRSRHGAAWRTCWRSYNPRHESPRRARRLRGRARAAAEAGVQRGLLALPLLRPHPGRHVSLQQARHAVRAAAGVPVLPAEDGGRVGLGQEPADADDPAGRDLDDGRRHRRGAPRRRRGASVHRGGAREADERAAPSGRRASSAARPVRPMLLAIDVGNTQTVFGLFDGDRLAEQFRVGTEPRHTADELAVLLRSLVDLESLDGIVLCSSVPQLVREYEALRRALGRLRAARARPRCLDRRADPLRRPARGRARPDRERGCGARAARCAGDRRRLRDLDQLRRRLGGRASSRAACSRRASRSRWTRCSRGRRGCPRCRSWRRSA